MNHKLAKPKVNLVGKKFHKWTVLAYIPGSGGYWKCVCDCGTVSRVNTTYLNNGDNKGCRECTTKLPKGEAAFNELVGIYKKNSLNRNLEFSLDKSLCRDLFTDNCYYCGSAPSGIQKPSSEISGTFLYNGIDRLDNSSGYIRDNCVTCCKICNHMKHVLSANEFESHIDKISSHLRKANHV